MITILDGGTGRELQRLGAPFRQPEWSALALMEAPEFVGQAHDRFATAGAEVITTNSYAIVPFHIGADRFAAEGLKLAKRAGEQARLIADRHAIKVAGSLPPSMGSYRADLFDAKAATAIVSTLIEGLEPFVDIWLAETLSCLDEAQLVGELLARDVRPLWLSFTLNDEAPAQLRSGESIADAARLARAQGAAAMLLNCSAPEVMDEAVQIARDALQDSEIRIGVYANGFAHSEAVVGANEGLRDIRADLGPDRYLAFARQWVASGASIVGGCCGIGPEHISALADGLKEDQYTSALGRIGERVAL